MQLFRTMSPLDMFSPAHVCSRPAPSAGLGAVSLPQAALQDQARSGPVRSQGGQ